jgi:serine/threonine-protein kinase
MTKVTGRSLVTLHRLLDEALDLEPGERAAWLHRLRLEQPALADELEDLFAAEPALEARGFLSDEIWPHLTASPTVPGWADQRVGAYTLESLLGQGGMGTVWLARRSDGRYEGRVAVKLLNLALMDAAGAARFRREGTLLARLSHPNIARLLDAGVTESGQPFLVLEHVEGERIDRYCDQRRLVPAQRL